MPGLARLGKDSFELVAVPRIMAGHGWVWHGAAGQGKDSFELVVVPRIVAR